MRRVVREGRVCLRVGALFLLAAGGVRAADVSGPGDFSAWVERTFREPATTTQKEGSKGVLDGKQPVARFAEQWPFSFEVGGNSSREFMRSWTRKQEAGQSAAGRPIERITWTGPGNDLEVLCELTLFKEYSAADWVLRLRNTGKSDSPMIENIRPLDLRLTLPGKSGDVVLHHAYGSTCAATDFLPRVDGVGPREDIRLAPRGGRSSDGQMPFFNLQWAGGGVIAAIGWSGQWCARVQRDAGKEVTVEAGQQFARFKLHPGETIRTPRILLVKWDGDDRFVGHNQLRRLLIDRYLPRVNGEVVVPPVTHNTWFAFNEGNSVTEQNQAEFIRAIAPTGVECFWLDAGWFEGGWPTGVGSWVPKKEAFPDGLKPVGDAAHAAGMKFVLWFEPERVNLKSRIAREHPEWLLHPVSGDPREHPEWVMHAGGGDGVFNLGDPAARAWLTDYLSRCISEWGIDVYRNDFNIDPLRFWQKADEPDRQGISEIRYIEGLYAMWDELLRRHPGIFIDNCASGGRRLDLEMLSRSVPLWRSDTPGLIMKPMPAQDQVQTAGLSLWVPFHSAGIWSFEPYIYRSVATTGINISQDARAQDYPADAARKAIAEVKRLRPMWMGSFYPLLDINLDERNWCGWQLNRADLGKGCVYVFRRAQSTSGAMGLNLRGLDAQAQYDVMFTDENRRERMRGEELAKLKVAIASAPGCTLVEYAKVH